MPEPSASQTGGDTSLQRLAALRKQILLLSREHVPLQAAAAEADLLLQEVQQQREHLLELNRGLSRAAAESAELLAEIEDKNRALERVNRDLSQANARAAELIGEIEGKNQRIDNLNQTLASANATAAELVAELELQRVELEKTNAALRKTNEEKAHILGVVAHDLRSGVGGLSGLADLLAGEVPPDNAEAVEFVTLLQQESRRLLTLLSTLLDMSRLEQGQLQLRLEVADLRPVLQDCIHYHQHFAELKQQTITADLAAEPLLAAFDRVRLRQLVDNLLSNAVKYTPPGLPITVRARCLGDEILVEFLDSGPGLTKDDIAKVFQSFQKLSAQPTAGEDSHGLGLAIARKVAESHHGRIRAENCPDHPGAVFSFALPARRMAGGAPDLR